MIRNIFLLVLLVGGWSAAEAQRYRNPQQYLRQFNNEKRKIDRKGLIYLQASLRGDEPRRVSKYHEMVLDQLRDSRRDIERIGAYEDYEILQREYAEGLDMLIEAYEKDFGLAEELREKKYESYEDLKKYYEAITRAEDEMYEAAYKLEMAEDHFAKTYFLDFERDEEVVEQYILLDEVTLYSRDMTLAFFRVQDKFNKFIAAAKAEKPDSLRERVVAIRKALDVSQKELAENADFEGRDWLYKELQHYLSDVREEIEQNLVTLAEKRENEFLDDKEYRNALRTLQNVEDRSKDRMEDFFDTRNKLIERYLPD